MPPPPPPDPADAVADADADAGGSAAAAPTSATVAALSGGAAVFAPRCLCVLSRGHFPLAFKASLSALLSMVGGAAPLPLETALSHLVLDVPAPRPADPASAFAVGAAGTPAPPLHVCCAPAAELPATDYSLGVLLERLTPNALLDLFGALLDGSRLWSSGATPSSASPRASCCCSSSFLCDGSRCAATAAAATTTTHSPPPTRRQVYVPTIPDGWLHLQHAAPLRPRSRAPPARCGSPDPPPEFMAIFDLDAPSCTLPSAPLPMLPPREASGLIEQLREAHANATGQVAPPDFSSTRRPPPAIADGGDGIGPVSQRLPPRFEGLVRAAFADFFVSLLRDLHLHVPDTSAHAADADGNGDGDGDGDGGGGGEADGDGAAARADLLDAQLEALSRRSPRSRAPSCGSWCAPSTFSASWSLPPPTAAEEEAGSGAAGDSSSGASTPT